MRYIPSHKRQLWPWFGLAGSATTLLQSAEATEQPLHCPDLDFSQSVSTALLPCLAPDLIQEKTVALVKVEVNLFVGFDTKKPESDSGFKQNPFLSDSRQTIIWDRSWAQKSLGFLFQRKSEDKLQLWKIRSACEQLQQLLCHNRQRSDANNLDNLNKFR